MSIGPRLEAELIKVESIHHIHGQECLCGFKSAVSRDRTKHIMEVTLDAAKPEKTGLLARLSASGGRNIDLLKRAQDAEAAIAGVRELHRPVWFAWVELDGTPGAGHICDHCTPEVGTEIVHYPCTTINVLEGSAS